MKKVIYLFSALLVFASCGEQENKVSTETNMPTAAPEANEPALSADEIIAKYDPVCRMELDAAWTDSLDHNGKMVHFCSTTCMNAFEAQPDKYLQ